MGSSNEMEQVDLIDRQAVIDLLKQMRKDGGMVPWEGKDVFARIRKLPSAQPDHTAEVSKMVGQTAKTTQNVPNDDSISRKAAIEAINTWDKFGVDERSRVVRWCEGLEPYVRLRDVVTSIANLPSAQPDLDSAYTEGYTAAESKYRKIFDEFLGIVFCKDCKHWRHNDHICQYYGGASPRVAIDFCSKGERRTDEGD